MNSNCGKQFCTLKHFCDMYATKGMGAVKLGHTEYDLTEGSPQLSPSPEPFACKALTRRISKSKKVFPASDSDDDHKEQIGQVEVEKVEEMIGSPSKKSRTMTSPGGEMFTFAGLPTQQQALDLMAVQRPKNRVQVTGGLHFDSCEL